MGTSHARCGNDSLANLDYYSALPYIMTKVQGIEQSFAMGATDIRHHTESPNPGSAYLSHCMRSRNITLTPSGNASINFPEAK